MREAFSANDIVQLSFAESTLKGAGIAFERTEPKHLLYVQGAADPVPGCLWVDDEDFDRAVVVLRDAFKTDVIR